MIPSPERHAEGVVDQPIDVVWNIITDSSKFHALKLPGLYSPFDRKLAGSGTQFEYRSINADRGKAAPQYVVAWEPPHLFSFGDSPREWIVEWRLSPSNEKTVVHFARRFGGSWLEGVIDRYLSGDLQKLTDNTVASLKDACSRLALGEADGLGPSPW